jgi:hypothetical protein
MRIITTKIVGAMLLASVSEHTSLAQAPRPSVGTYYAPSLPSVLQSSPSADASPPSASIAPLPPMAPAMRPPAVGQLPQGGAISTLQGSPTAADAIRVINFGNQALSIAYWDGQSDWRTIRVAPTQTADIRCAQCGNTITVAYHDGKENRTVRTTTGSDYRLVWSQAQIWELESLSGQAIEIVKGQN